jgi:PAS domain S-box-containing protein
MPMRPQWNDVAPTGLLSLACLAAYLLGQAANANIALGDWFSPSVGLATLALAGTGLWPGVMVGTTLGGLMMGADPGDALVSAATSTLCALLGARACVRIGDPNHGFASLERLLRFVVLGALLPTLPVVASLTATKVGSTALTAITHWTNGILVLLVVGIAVQSWLTLSGARRLDLLCGTSGRLCVGLGGATLVLGGFQSIFNADVVLSLFVLLTIPAATWAMVRGDLPSLSALMLSAGVGITLGGALMNALGVDLGGPSELASTAWLSLALHSATLSGLVLVLLSGTTVVQQLVRAGREKSIDRQQYESLIEGIGEALFSVSSDGRLMFVNNAWLALTGYRAECVLGRPLREFLRDPATGELPGALRALASRGEAWRGELMLGTADGRQKHVEVSVRRARSLVQLSGTIRDITTSRSRIGALEEQLRARNDAPIRSAARLALLDTLARVPEIHSDMESALEAALDLTARSGLFGARVRTGILFTDPNLPRIVGADIGATHRGLNDLVARAIDDRGGVASDTSASLETRATALRSESAPLGIWVLQSYLQPRSDTPELTFAPSVAEQLLVIIRHCVAHAAARHDQRDREQLRHQNMSLTRRMLDLQEVERQTIARELHDELGQWLVGIQAETAHLLSESALREEPQLTESAQSVHVSAARIYDVTHALMSRLRPPLLDELGLAPTIDDLARNSNLLTGPTVTVEMSDTLEDISEPLDIQVYRIVQEAVTDAQRNTTAKNVTISIGWEDGENRRLLRVQIGHDGDATSAGPGVLEAGPVALKDRANAIGASVEMVHNRGGGTTIVALIPNGAQNRSDEAHTSTHFSSAD